MESRRKIAIVVGVLFIVATGAAMLQFPLIGSASAPDYLARISKDEPLVMTALLLDLLMIAAVVGIPVALYPVLRQWSPTLARGYLVARIFEAIPLTISTVCFLLLLILSREYVSSGALGASHFGTLGAMLRSAWDLTLVIGGQLVFCLTALILNFALYGSRLVPRALSVWGLFGVPLMFVSAVLVLYGILEDGSTLQTALMLPLAVQEMAFALWLIIKGFSPEVATGG